VFKLANPAPWRTVERIREDLADPMVDEQTKFRLYGNKRGSGASRWITDEAWDACHDRAELPDGTEIAIGVDGARTRDTTVVAWAWRRDG
jgi:phage terminase large subunit-like protein